MGENSSSLDLAKVRHRLGASSGRFSMTALECCSSTNSVLLEEADAGAASGSVVVADRQTSGRGRRGRTWHSSAAESLTFSLLWRFPAGSAAPAALSLATGLAVARALEALGARDVTLKWPNDVLWSGRKLGGILIELLAGNLRAAVIGIGLNLKLPQGLPPEVAETAIALEALGLHPTRENLLAILLEQLATTIDTYSTSGFDALHADWTARHAFHDRQVYISSDGPRIAGTCLGVDADGALLLSTTSGLRKIVGGEMSLSTTA